MGEEKLTSIIALRIFPSFKKQLVEEAREREETLSEYIYELIVAGGKQISKEGVKQTG